MEKLNLLKIKEEELRNALIEFIKIRKKITNEITILDTQIIEIKITLDKTRELIRLETIQFNDK